MCKRAFALSVVCLSVVIPGPSDSLFPPFAVHMFNPARLRRERNGTLAYLRQHHAHRRIDDLLGGVFHEQRAACSARI